MVHLNIKMVRRLVEADCVLRSQYFPVFHSADYGFWSMLAVTNDSPSFREQVGSRLRELEKRFANRSVAAEAAGVVKSTLQNWIEGRADPSFEGMARLARAAGVSVEWLATGVEASGAGELPAIPRYDLSLSAGAGTFIDRAPLLDYIPFTEAFLRRKLGRTSTDGLVMLDARGDSMEPTIGDGDLVMVDMREQDLQGGLMAFVFDDTAFIKRLRPQIGGGVEIVSDNAELYPPQWIDRERLGQLQLIGRVRWVGRVL